MKLADLEQEYYKDLGKYAFSHAYDDFDDIFLFGMRFYLSVCHWSLGKNKAEVDEIGDLDFTVEGYSCQQLFMSFYSPLIRHQSFECIKFSLECKLLTLLKCSELSKIDVLRLYVFYIVLCHCFYGYKDTMVTNLKFIFKFGNKLCSVNALSEIHRLNQVALEFLSLW